MKKDFLFQLNFSHKMRGVVPIFVLDVNCVYYGLKSCILVEVDVLWITGRSHYLKAKRHF
jgi:hypothetical protein